MPNESSDKAWAELRRGNPDALSDLYRQHYVGLINYGIKLTGNHEFARDCITQVLLNLHRQHKRLPEVTNVRSYLLSCMRNQVNVVLRSEGRMKLFDPSIMEDIAGSFSDEIDLVNVQQGEEQQERLKRALSQLTSRENELLRLRFFEDKSYDSIASECGITKRTAYNIIHTALKRMKELLVSQAVIKSIYILLSCLFQAEFMLIVKAAW